MAIQNGFLLIADITGYTVYLNQSELEHAHEVLQTLLELLIEHTRPPLVISRLAGDAVISYGLQPGFLNGQTFVELIEDTYVAFRKAIDVMVLNNTCKCNACTNTGNLDLKFFVHFGSFVLQKLDAHNELVGTDVNVIHRLLKNRVTEATGFRAYALYTEAALRQLGPEEISQDMVEHAETYPDVGEIKLRVQNMHPVWQAKKDLSRIKNPPDKSIAYAEIVLPVPVMLAWEVITHPEYRAVMTQSARQELQNRKKGRIGQGSVFECFHGKRSSTLQTILEWLPPEQLTTQDTTPIPNTTCLSTILLAPHPDGTKVSITISPMQGPFFLQLLGNLVSRLFIEKSVRQGAADLLRRTTEDLAAGKLQAAEHVHPGEDHLKAEIKATLVQNHDLSD